MQIENNSLLISIDSLMEERMLTIKGQQVLLDSDIAQLYQVKIHNLHRKVRENKDRFPERFMFTISANELRKKIPSIPAKRKKVYVFTWGGIMMTSGLFRTQRAIEMSLQLIRYYSKYMKGGIFKMLGEESV